MATAAELHNLLAEARHADDVAARYDGARVWRTGIGVLAIDFGKAADPELAWSRYHDDTYRAMADEAARDAAQEPAQRAAAELRRLAERYTAMVGAEACHLEADRHAPIPTRATERADAPPEPESAPAVAVAGSGPSKDYSAPALPPRRRSRVNGARTEPVAGGRITGKLTRG